MRKYYKTKREAEKHTKEEDIVIYVKYSGYYIAKPFYKNESIWTAIKREMK